MKLKLGVFMDKYFLVARNKKDNKFRLIGINDTWYSDFGGFGCVSIANPLPVIDLVTSRFRSKEQMIKRMYENKFIDSMDVDLFIAAKRKRNEEEKLVTYEVIYDPARSERIKEFRKVARSFMDNKKEDTEDFRKKIFDKLISKTFYNIDYYMFIKDGMTNIPMRVVNRLVGLERLKKPPYSVKYKEEWVVDNFLALRNIVESLNRFDLLEKYPDKIYANIDFLNDNARGRKIISRELIKAIDEELITAGQVSLLDVENEENTNFKYVNIPIEKSEKEVLKKESDIDIVNTVSEKGENKEISTAKKLKEVLFVFDTLPIGVFKRKQEDVSFNEEIFDNYPCANDRLKLKKIIKSKRLLSNIYFYVLHNNKCKDATKHHWSSLEIDADLRADLRDLKKTLSKGKNLDNAYEWCEVYRHCAEFDKECIATNSTMEIKEEGKKFEKKNL